MLSKMLKKCLGMRTEDATDLCQYCYDDTTEETGKLVTPCKCGGGTYKIHQNCIRTAVMYRADKSWKCQLCLHEYELVTPEPLGCKDFFSPSFFIKNLTFLLILVLLFVLDILTLDAPFVKVLYLIFAMWYLIGAMSYVYHFEGKKNRAKVPVVISMAKEV